MTSSICPFCGTRGNRRHRGLFYCPNCDKVMNADVVDVLNIAKKNGSIIPSPSWRDRDNGLVAQPLLLRWNGMKWEPKRAMNTRPMKTLEARIPLLK
ncbi:MAG: transposase [Thermoproteales archaeon]|nr:transposase [Thermoproteales archaeon]